MMELSGDEGAMATLIGRRRHDYTSRCPQGKLPGGCNYAGTGPYIRCEGALPDAFAAGPDKEPTTDIFEESAP